MYNRFKELGVPVVITRDTDKSLTRSERINTMKSLGTDPNVIVLSNHINAGGGSSLIVVKIKSLISIGLFVNCYS